MGKKIDTALENWRGERFHTTTSSSQRENDFRTPWERDRDRILYSCSFRRLAVITQVISPTDSFSGHNRLTHALKVGQLARSLARNLKSRYESPKKRAFLDRLGGLDLDVAEAAGLAHDLGHPPFGHIAEEELDNLVRAEGVPDGFEGNAQSLRLVAALECRNPKIRGLNLTRATINALLKYPYRRKIGHHKFGVYSEEADLFSWARDGKGEERSLEADVMDWADDITYAVHDMEDFYRVGKIPLDRLVKSIGDERKDFLKGVDARGRMRNRDVDLASNWLFNLLPVSEPYQGTDTQRAALRAFASSVITEAISTTEVKEGGLLRNRITEDKIILMKELTWHYVILSEGLKTQQAQQREIIRNLFACFLALSREHPASPIFPSSYRDQFAVCVNEPLRVRLVADLISGMGEEQAINAFHVLSDVSWSVA